MNLLAVVTGIAIGVLNLQIYVVDILSPPGEGFKPRALLAFLSMILFLPLFIDCILAYRLYIVYPPQITSKLQLAAIFIPVIVFKIARITNLIIFMVKFAAVILVPDATSAVENFQILWDHAPWTKIEWILQVFDNCWASGLFLWKIKFGRKAETSGMVPSRASSKRFSGDKLKSLFYLALSTFMFPCMFSIAQIILAFHNHDFFLGAYVFVNNLYIEIIGVLLATIWASKSRLENATGSPKSCTQSSIAYRIGGNGSHGVEFKTGTSHGGYTRTGVGSNFSRGDVELGEFDAALPQEEQPEELLKSRAFGRDIDSV